MAMTESFSSEQFALRWNNFFLNLSSGFLSHLNNKDLVDVTLAVDGQLIQAHKLVLSVCSTYFRDIFKGNPCKHPVIILQDIGFKEINALLKFMYQGEVNVKQDDLASFLKVAETLKVKGLTFDKNFQNESQDNECFDCESSKNLNGTTKTETDSDHSVTSGESSKSLAQEKNLKKRRQNPTSLNSNFKKTRCSSLVENSVDSASRASISPKIEPLNDDNDNDDNPITAFTNENFTENSDATVDVKKDDEFIDNEEILSADEETRNPEEPNVEPVTYRLSARGRPQLVHGGFVYNLTSRSEVLNRSHYRCAEQHRGCRGKCAVIAERFMPTGVNEHNHAPGYQSEHDYRKKKGPDVETNC